MQTLRVAAAGTLRHMPQPTILFDGSGLTRRTTIHLEEGAGLTFCEGMVLGRQAMGESVRTVSVATGRRSISAALWCSPMPSG